MPTPTASFDEDTKHEDQGAKGIHVDNSELATKGDGVALAARRGNADIPLTSVEARCITPPPPRAEPILLSGKIPSNKSAGLYKSRRSFRSASKRSKMPGLYSTLVDVDSLAFHQMPGSNRQEDTEKAWISDDELRGVLKTAILTPSKRLSNSLPHPVTPQELEFRLHQALTLTPLPSLSRLINYHDSYPSLHSASSYNFLVQFAIRHTTYTKAFQLMRCMEKMGIKPDDYSKLLYVRLLVRVGKWSRAWSFVRQELSSGDAKTNLSLLLELLGHRDPVKFGDKPAPDADDDPPDTVAAHTMSEDPPDGVHNASLLRGWQKSILTVIPNHLPAHGHPPVHFILMVVRHLLRNSRMTTARAVSLEWISHQPKRLSLPRKRHCLCLLHLHLAFSRKSIKAHLSNREFVELFLRQRPSLQPNSTTLFLLLRGLTRASGKPTFHALKLVRAYRNRWGSNVIDRRVRRRIISIAVREGRLNVARTWMEAEDRASISRNLLALQRDVVGEQAVKLPQKIRRIPFQKLMPRIHAENRKWRWVKRRVWRLQQSHESRRPSQSQTVVSDIEKNVTDQPFVDT